MVALAAFGSRRHRGEQKKRQRGLWTLVPLLVLSVSSVFSSGSFASAEPQAGLDVAVYNNFGYNGAPPLPEVSGRPVAGTTVFANVDQDFDQSPPFGLYEDYIVQYTGYITSPVSASIVFLPTADDGTKLLLDGVLIDDNWRDKGGGGNPTAPQAFTAGVPRQFTHWFYENGGGSWTTLYWDIGRGWEVVPAAAFTRTAEPQASVATTTTTTTLAPYLNSPKNLTVTSTNETKVYLEWDAPEVSNAQVERYAVFFSKDNWSSGWAISSTQTSAIVENLDPGTTYQFKVRADNDSLPAYSGWSNEVNGATELPPITYSTSNAIWETSSEGSNLTLTAPNGNQFTEVLFASYGTPTGSNGLYRTSQCHSLSSLPEVEAVFIGKTSATISADNGVFGDPCGGTYKYLTVVLKYGPVPTTTSTTTTTTTIAPIVTWPKIITTTTTTEAPVASTTTTAPPETTTTSSSTTTTSSTSTTVPATTTTVAQTTTTVPRVEEKLPVPAPDEIAKIESPAELSKLVATVDLKSIEPDQVVALVTNEAFLELPQKDLQQVFESVDIQELSPAQEAQLVETLTSAPDEVKETFEGAVDIYGEGFDDYVPTGSAVDVATRRSVIAVTTVLATATAAGGAPGTSNGGPTGGSSGGGGSGGSPSDSNKAARREDEKEDEEAGGLEGPEDREKNTNTHNSIYKYQENGMKKFSIIGFIKKFMKETAALSFTFAGSAIMFVTLSGDTQRIAIIATAIAVTVHYINVMLENDEE